MTNSPSHPQFIHYPCPAQWYVNGIAIALQQLDLEAPTSIPIQATETPGSYRSPILLRYQHLNPQFLGSQINDIASHHFQAQLQDEEQSSPPQNQYHLGIESNGWLSMSTSLELQIHCISQIIQWTGIKEAKINSNHRHQELIWELQYAHARCSSLLNLAMETFGHDYPQTFPQSLTGWLRSQFSTPYSDLQCERHLWHSLLNFPLQLQGQNLLKPDLKNNEAVELATLTPKSKSNIGWHWVKLFQKFYSVSPILNLAEPQQSPLRSLRVELLQGLQKVLSFLLTNLFSSEAPSRL